MDVAAENHADTAPRSGLGSIRRRDLLDAVGGDLRITLASQLDGGRDTAFAA